MGEGLGLKGFWRVPWFFSWIGVPCSLGFDSLLESPPFTSPSQARTDAQIQLQQHDTVFGFCPSFINSPGQLAQFSRSGARPFTLRCGRALTAVSSSQQGPLCEVSRGFSASSFTALKPECMWCCELCLVANLAAFRLFSFAGQQVSALCESCAVHVTHFAHHQCDHRLNRALLPRCAGNLLCEEGFLQSRGCALFYDFSEHKEHCDLPDVRQQACTRKIEKDGPLYRKPGSNPTICMKCEFEPACAFSSDFQVARFTLACQAAQMAYERPDLDSLVHVMHDQCVYCLAEVWQGNSSPDSPRRGSAPGSWGLRQHGRPNLSPLTGPYFFPESFADAYEDCPTPDGGMPFCHTTVVPQHFTSGSEATDKRLRRSRRSRCRRARRSRLRVHMSSVTQAGQCVDSLEDLLSINPCQEPSGPPNWDCVASLVTGALEHGCSVFESRFIKLAEHVENNFDDNTLEWWVCSHLLDCAVEQANPAWAQPALLDLISRSSGATRSAIRILSANVTCWGPKIKDWLLGTIGSWEMLCVQETHLLKDIPEIEAALSGAALSHHFGPGHCSDKGGVLGGLLTVAPTHRNTRKVVEILKDGCGIIGDELRLQGWTLLVFNVYLQSGASLQGEVNSWILSKFLSLVQGIGVPWIAIGDFNVPAADFDCTSIPSEAKAELVTPLEPTTDHGATLDYALVSSGLRGSSAISVCWVVPFKPHGMLQLSVEGSCDMPFPQLPRYQQIPDKPAKPFHIGPTPSTVLWDGQHLQDHASCRFAAWSAAVGFAFDLDEGPGTGFKISRKPLIRTHSPSRIWVSEDLAFWERLSAWAHRVQQNTWNPRKMSKPVEVMLSEVPSHWKFSAAVTCESWCTMAGNILSNLTGPSQEWLDQLQAQHKAALSEQLSSKNLQYRKWLEGATVKGMRPLFRALKSAEAVTIRPYRESGLEIRPYLRLESWAKLWEAGPVPLPRVSDELSAMARQHAQTLPAFNLNASKKVLAALSNKAGGADGLSYLNLKLLPDDAFDSLLCLMRDVELSGSIPQQWATTVITMLAKNERVERPIALCHAAYRLWAKLRFAEVKTWLQTFTVQAPWEFALPGYSPLDVSIRRLMQAEITKANRHCRATIFIDLQTFYESVCHSALAAQAMAHGFPPVLVEVALGVYRGARYIDSEGVASPRCYASKGLMAGCPLAPSLAKLAIYPVLQKLHRSLLCEHATVWLDDVSADSEGHDPVKTASRSYKAFCLLDSEFRNEGLSISTSKTCWVVSDTRTAKALNSLRSSTDPPIKALARDLGTDYAAARRRRVTVASGREHKGQKRAFRLRRLRVPALQHKWRAFKSGVFAASAWGHQAQGLSPKRLRWLRACGAQQLGRHKLGDTDVVYDFHPNFVDPLLTIIQQHFTTIARCLRRWPQDLWERLSEAWVESWVLLSGVEYPWKRVAGPLAAAQAYLLQLGFQAPNLSEWRLEGETIRCDWQDPAFQAYLLGLLRDTLLSQRHCRIADTFDSPALASGLDWTCHRTLLKQKAGRKQSVVALKAIWQGAILHNATGGPDTCPLCQVPATWKHVLLDCTFWRSRHRPVPAHWDALKTSFPSACFWERALVPLQWVTPHRPAEATAEVCTGTWKQQQVIGADGLVFSTDASGGPFSVDGRLRIVTFAVAAFKWVEGDLVLVASITGVLPHGSSIVQGEAEALKVLNARTSGCVDVTVDCRPAIYQVRKTLDARLSCVWVRSHLDIASFSKEFGADQLWRRHVNCVADDLCGKRAESLLDQTFVTKVRQIDKLVSCISAFLAERAEFLLFPSKLDPPPMHFVERRKSKASGSVVSPSPAFNKPRGAAQLAVRCKTTETSKAVPPKPNKRQRLQELLDNADLGNGHVWKKRTVATSTAAINLAVSCERCHLYIEQINTPAIFDRKIAHPCIGIPAALPTEWVLHSSHTLQNKGSFWICESCSAMVKVAAAKSSLVLQNPCKGLSRKGGKVPKSAYQLETPKSLASNT